MCVFLHGVVVGIDYTRRPLFVEALICESLERNWAEIVVKVFQYLIDQLRLLVLVESVAHDGARVLGSSCHHEPKASALQEEIAS
jgi:hypothetical protein